MFGKGNFDGQFRTKPSVSIRGATKSESKEQLLKRVHDERLNREVRAYVVLKRKFKILPQSKSKLDLKVQF